jgi:predicted transcriptional regulator of viral defense system
MPTGADLLGQLGPVFRWREARHAGLSDPTLNRLLTEGRLERISHGLYLRADARVADLDLVVVAAANDRSTLCLTSALARHDLTDQIPTRIDVALPRDARPPKVSAPVRWHRFAPATFDLGRDTIALDGGYVIGLYSPERSIVDAYRLRHLEGDELGREALKAWLRQRGSQPSRLLEVAASFPKALGRLREDLRVLL